MIFGALHLIALALGAILFIMFLRAETADGINPPEDEEGGGGGGNDRISPSPQTSPSGGVPLLDAEPQLGRHPSGTSCCVWVYQRLTSAQAGLRAHVP